MNARNSFGENDIYIFTITSDIYSNKGDVITYIHDTDYDDIALCRKWMFDHVKALWEDNKRNVSAVAVDEGFTIYATIHRFNYLDDSFGCIEKWEIHPTVVITTYEKKLVSCHHDEELPDV